MFELPTSLWRWASNRRLLSKSRRTRRTRRSSTPYWCRCGMRETESVSLIMDLVPGLSGGHAWNEGSAQPGHDSWPVHQQGYLADWHGADCHYWRGTGSGSKDFGAEPELNMKL